MCPFIHSFIHSCFSCSKGMLHKIQRLRHITLQTTMHDISHTNQICLGFWDWKWSYVGEIEILGKGNPDDQTECFIHVTLLLISLLWQYNRWRLPGQHLWNSPSANFSQRWLFDLLAALCSNRSSLKGMTRPINSIQNTDSIKVPTPLLYYRVFF